MALAGNQSLLKKINLMALARHVAHTPGLSRIELSKATGLTKSTVSVLVQELIDTGFLIENNQLPSTGNLGRRPTPLYLDEERLMIFGVDLSVEHIYIIAATLTGKIVESTYCPLETSDVSSVLQILAKAVAKLRKHPKLKRRSLLGIGVGVPGSVRNPEGIIALAPNLRWREIAFLEQFSNALEKENIKDIPLYVGNDYNAAALSEYEFGPHPLPDPLLYVGLGVGIGAGIIAHNRLFLGAQGFAGEVGHMIINEQGTECACGRFGCAETLIGQRALSQKLHAPQGQLISIEELKARLAQKDPSTLKAVQEAGSALGLLLQNLWTAFNPGRIVLGGPLCELGTAFLNPAYQTLERYTQAAMLPAPEIEISQFGKHSIAMGGTALVRHPLLHPFKHGIA